MFVCLSVRVPVCLYVCLSVCTCTCLSVTLPACLPAMAPVCMCHTLMYRTEKHTVNHCGLMCTCARVCGRGLRGACLVC